MNLHQNDIESYQAFGHLEEDIWPSNHDAVAAIRHIQTDSSDAGIEKLNEMSGLLPPGSPPDLIHRVDEDRRTDAPDDKSSLSLGHEHGLTDEPPVPDIGLEDKDTNDFGR